MSGGDTNTNAAHDMAAGLTGGYVIDQHLMTKGVCSDVRLLSASGAKS